MATHYALVKGDNGLPSQLPFKQWVRQNGTAFPAEFNADGKTTYQLRRYLIQSGWRLESFDSQVFVIRPDESGSFQYASDFLSGLDIEMEVSEAIAEEAKEVTFSLERDMQVALRKNIEALEVGLMIIDNGKERNVPPAGRIDITAKDKNERAVIIELKAIDARPEVVAQTLAYMQAVKEEDNTEVRGIIVASGFHDKVILAARQIPNLKLIKYSFQFNYLTVD